ncbi:GNAT superfamily N-acetyltransferase [Nakamurella sp. UYEF19]|uniref:GNAT family N-acetyltransferase n=1 Tax=Nakamurella sp. UYEF19 TaxID=1756392 RepID=UPI00339952DD
MKDSADVPRRIVIHTADWDASVAIDLRDEQQRELRDVYDGDAEPGIKPSASDVAIFLVAYADGADVDVAGADSEAIGCGGLRPLTGEQAEIKRMYVRPAHRGRGVSRLILAALERQALAGGWTDLVLETGPLQTAAICLYETAGYRVIPNFGAYRDSPTSVCFGKTLPA